MLRIAQLIYLLLYIEILNGQKQGGMGFESVPVSVMLLNADAVKVSY